MTMSLRLKRQIRAGLAAILLAACIFTTNTFAHNINLDKAWAMARDYARIVRKESPRRYLHYATNCKSTFSGHNHIVRCVAQYQNEKDTNAGVYTCTETFEFYLNPHRDQPQDYNRFARHTSGNKCGPRDIVAVQLAGEIGY